jgi:hypothetical protein
MWYACVEEMCLSVWMWRWCVRESWFGSELCQGGRC